MRAVIQRVSRAEVRVGEDVTGKIGPGILLLLGVSIDDAERDAEYLLEKTVNLRIFEDAEGKMNLSLLDTGGELLVVSQFTLYGDTRRGRRPSFIRSAPPDRANELYEHFVRSAQARVANVATGRFQAMMNVELVNDGPVTIMLDSERVF
ncbi:MAG TPA: D-aminoacyl-tRNA deacylase [Pyrinomonadaceae bacterium]|nr:D-aminoacyl-tRNA deacylase [Pyrinomonadaceae bacterium]